MNSTEIKDLGRSLGADLVGIASIESFTDAPDGYHPIDVLPSAKSVIVLATVLPKNTLEEDIKTYTTIRNEAVHHMDKVAAGMAAELKKLKYKAIPIVSLGGKWIPGGHFRSRISLKHAAECAGLGIVARNYLLTNEQYGNLLWFTAVITSLELEPDPIVTYNICDGCNLCVESCPSGALTDQHNFNQRGCRRVCYIVTKGTLELRCWQCRNVCPNKFGIIAK